MSYERVLGDLAEDIARDQRAYKLAMDGAELSEHDSLITIVDLERRWSEYEFEWAEMDSRSLARRILTFEQERERRQEMISFADYRAEGRLIESGESAPAVEDREIPVVKIGVAILAVLLIISLLIVIF